VQKIPSDKEDAFAGFDDLAWEVELTENALKWFRTHIKKQRGLCKDILVRVRELANGRWDNSNKTKPLKGVDVKGVVLMETKVGKASRVIWEAAIAFSPRRSSSDGAIFAEVIRIWAIVLKHDDVNREMRRILQSHKRGQQCRICRALHKIVRDRKSESSHSNQRLPSTFSPSEAESTMKLLTAEEKELLLDRKRQVNETQNDAALSDIEKELFYPAASDDLTQYNSTFIYIHTPMNNCELILRSRSPQVLSI
jgi:hypothetical protein